MAFALQSGELIYRLSPGEQVDQDAYGMLRNNVVEHIVGVNYRQLDDSRELRFATEGLQSARDCFARRAFNRQQFVDVLMGVADAFADAEEYMLSAESFSNSLDTTFFDDQLNVSLTYVPIVGFTSCAGARVFIRDVRRCMQPDGSAGDVSFLRPIDDALNRADDFSVVEFKKLLASLTLKPKQAGLSSTGTGRGFAPVDGGFAAQNPNLGIEAVPSGQQPDGNAFSGQQPQGGPLGGGGIGGQGFGQAPGFPAGGGTGGAGGSGIPPAGSAPSSFGGMAIPGMEGQQFPTGGTSEKKGLFGKGKKEKNPASGKMSRAEKKAAKEAEKAAEKAAKEAAKVAKKQKRGKPADGEKSGGLFSRKKSRDAQASPIPPQGGGPGVPFPVPGGGQGAVPGGGMAIPPGAPQGNGMPNQGQGLSQFGQTPQPMQPAQPVQPAQPMQPARPMQPMQPVQPVQQPPFGQQPSQPAPAGEQYSDNDFGITEVYGVEPKGGAGNGGEIPRLFGSQPEQPGLPVTAYLYRESTGEKRLIDRSPFRVGRRRSEVDFHIAEKPKVSRVHAIITFDGSRFMIRDNKSVNHTAINGHRIDPEEVVALVNGDFIEMGDERFRFTLE